MRIRHYLGAILIALFSMIFLFGCNTEVTPEKTITSVALESQDLLTPIEIETFNLSSIRLKVTYSDGSQDSIPVSSDMLSQQDILKLGVIGTHQITVRYQGFNIPLTLTLKNQSVLDLLMSYYHFAQTQLGYQGTYTDWINSLIQGRPVTIIFAQMNDQQEFIITFSNQETLNLGKMSVLTTYTVNFYNFYGELISSVIVPHGGSAVAPMPPILPDHQFMGWDQILSHVTSSLEVHAIYQWQGVSLEIDDADRLLISIDRLEKAQFMINLDSIFTQTSSTQKSQRSQLLSSLIYKSTSRNQSNPYDIENYVSHNYWRDFYYHKNLYQEPNIIDGFYVITQTLTSYNDHALNNLYIVTEQVTQNAKKRADWAVDNITVVDTWVTVDQYKYLLHYDEALDRVELYTIWTYEPYAVTSYEKIYVYFNENGEEVIESWIEQIYTTPEYPGVMVYHNSVGARDFNYYSFWLDENYEAKGLPHFRGVNRNEEGFYEYYDNHYHMISRTYGWYTIIPGINVENGIFYYPETPDIQVYSPDASSNVINVATAGLGQYAVTVYLPSMNGVEAILIKEGGMVNVNQDSYHSQQVMLNAGVSLMPDWWQMSEEAKYNIDYPTGFRTHKGTFMSSNEPTDELINFRDLTLNIGSEGIKQYNQMFNYYAVIRLYVRANSLDELTDRLTQYLDDVGLSYKYGNTDDLFSELKDVMKNYEALGRDISIINDTLPGPKHTYQDLETVVETENFLKNYLRIRFDLISMVERYDEIPMANMPKKEDLSRISLLSTANMLTGKVSFLDNQIHTELLTATLRKTPILQQNEDYTLVYGLMIGGKLILLDTETAKTYSGSDISFNGSKVLNIPQNLTPGTYTFVVFFAKITPLGLLRISSVEPWEVLPFDSSEILNTLEPGEETLKTLISSVDNHLTMIVSMVDLYPPKLIILDSTIYQGVIHLDQFLMPIGSTVEDLLLMMQIHDTTDGLIEATLDMITHDGQPVELTDELTSSGWIITVFDQSGNETRLIMDQIEFGYMVKFMIDDQIYFETVVLPGQQVQLPDSPQLVGRTFIKWDIDSLEVNDHLIVYGTYTINTYQITWIYESEVVLIDEAVPYGSVINRPIMPSIDGYRFVWNLSKTTMPEYNLEVTGEYLLNTYYLYFKLGDQFYEVHSYFYGDPVIYPEPVAPLGFHFSGWSVSFETMPNQSVIAEGSFIPNNPS